MTHASTLNKIGNFDGKDVFEVELISRTNVKVSFLNYGALIRDWRVPLKDGTERHVVCGFDEFESYPKYSPNFGAIIGRVANRIGGSKFEINGKEYKLVANEGPNHLHGGPNGFGKRVWDVKIINDGSVRFTINSSDGEMGYPGNVNCIVTYRLSDYKLHIKMEATSDTDTPLNLTQHNYFNLTGLSCEIAEHKLWINAREMLVIEKDSIPNGEIKHVNDTFYDFTTPKELKDADGSTLKIDNTLVLDNERKAEEPAAILESPDGQLTLKMWTDQPSVHVYTASKMNVSVPGINNQRYSPFNAICLEDQNFPDAVNHPNFPCSILSASDIYTHICDIEISPN